MAGLKIDLDRDIEYGIPPARRPRGGVSIRRDPETGADVFMYNSQPGVYYSANGIEVSSSMAARAGFDVEWLAAEQLKRQKMADFARSWADEHKTRDKRVVAERGQYKLVHIVGSGFYIEHVDGTNMTRDKRAPTEQAGMDWLTDFAGPAPEVVNGDTNGTSGSSESGTDRRPGEDGRSGGDLGKSVNKKTPVPA